MPNKDAVNVMLEEYKRLSDEIGKTLTNRLTIIGLGVTAIGVVFVSVTKATTGMQPDLPGLALYTVVPAISFLVIHMWLSEVRRGRRASWYIWSLERKINAKLQEDVLAWERDIRNATEPILSVYRSHYYVTVAFFLLVAFLSMALDLSSHGWSLCHALLLACGVAAVIFFFWLPDLIRLRKYDREGTQWPFKDNR
jgi:hypothetical protein